MPKIDVKCLTVGDFQVNCYLVVNTETRGCLIVDPGAEGERIIRAAQEYNLTYYQSGGQPSGILRTGADLGGYAKDPNGKVLTRKDGSWITRKDQLRSEWEKVHAGPKNAQHALGIGRSAADLKQYG